MRLNLFRIRTKFRINLFRMTVHFFLTDTCIGVKKVREYCLNNKLPDKSSAGLTRLDCIYLTKKTELCPKQKSPNLRLLSPHQRIPSEFFPC